MSVDTKKLRELAEAATPGPWRVDIEKQRTDGNDKPRVMGIYGPERIVDYGMGPERDDLRIVETDGGYYEPRWDDAAFIAAANPQAVIALLDLLSEVERVSRVRDEHNEEMREQLAAANDMVGKVRREWQIHAAKYESDLQALDEQLAAMTKARDEACDIADRMIDLAECDDEGWQSNAYHVRSNIAALRKVGAHE